MTKNVLKIYFLINYDLKKISDLFFVLIIFKSFPL